MVTLILLLKSCASLGMQNYWVQTTTVLQYVFISYIEKGWWQGID